MVLHKGMLPVYFPIRKPPERVVVHGQGRGALIAVSTGAASKPMAIGKDTHWPPPWPARALQGGLGKVTHSFLCAWPQETDLQTHS